jgi:hypothetical protein
VPSPRNQGEGHGSGEEPGSAAAKDSPAYGARNVPIVAAGTGEALPGPVTCGSVTGVWRPITGDPGKWTLAGWASEAAVVPVEPQISSSRTDQAATSGTRNIEANVSISARMG